jgi:ABC-type transport system involved in multi-copper enzyme maturation permease subunit
VRTILLIAADSVRALLHQRLLLGLMLVALAMIAIFSSALIGQRKVMTRTALDQSAANAPSARDAGRPPGDASHMSKEEQQKLATNLDQMSAMFQAVFYQVTSFGGSLVSLFIFSTAVASEIRKGTVRITLTKPVSRSQFLLGKYLGGVAVMAGYALIASVAIILFARLGRLELSPTMKFAPWLMFCRQLMLGSLAMLLSLFVHPFLAAVLAFFAGNGLYSSHNPLFYVLPSYSPFNVSMQLLSDTLLRQRDVLILSLYAGDFIVLMMLISLWRFRNKELV